MALSPSIFAPKMQYVPIKQWLGRLPTACVLGHSFSKHQEDELVREMQFRNLWWQVESGKKSRGIMNAEMLRVDEVIYDVNFKTCTFLESYHNNQQIGERITELHLMKPDIVVIDLGSNDLTKPGTDPRVVAVDLFELGVNLRVHGGARMVAFMSCLNRAAAPADFRTNAHLFNQTLDYCCDGNIGLLFHNTRAFGRVEPGIPSDVEEWSDDGIHPRRGGKHFYQYRAEIRQTLMNCVPALGRTIVKEGL